MMIFNSFVRRNTNNSSSLSYVWFKKSYYYYYYYFSTSSTCNKEEKQQEQPISISEYLLKKHHFSPEVTSHVASFSTLIKNPERSDSILSYFKHVGFSDTQLERTIKYRSTLLSADLDKTIKPKIKILQDFGFSSNDIAYIVSEEPRILHTSAQNYLIPALDALKGLFGGSTAKVVKAVRRCGWLLTTDVEKTLFPNIEFLTKSCGVTMDQIMGLLHSLPRFLLYRPELMREIVETVNRMGFDKSSKAYLYAVCIVGAMTKGKWEMKLQAFRDIMEFSDDDISRVVKTNPHVFKVSEKKMKKIKEVLLGTGKYKTSCIVKYPLCVNFSIENRFKPRLQVLEKLESRGIIKKWPCLGTLYGMSDAKFFEAFVRPYFNELGDVYKHKKFKQ